MAGGIIVGLALAAGYFLWPGKADSSPTKGFEELLTDLASPTVEDRNHAQAEVARQGTNLIPSLISLLGPDSETTKDGEDPSRINRLEGSMKRERLRAFAVTAFDLLGPTAGGAAPELARLMNSSNTAAYAARALAAIGAEEQLRQSLQASDPSVRAHAALGLGYLKTNLTSVVDALVAAMKDPDKTVRANAAAGLGSISTAPERALPALSAALKDTDAIVRLAAAKALGKFEQFDAASLPALEEAKNDRDPQVRRAVRRTIARLTRAKKTGE